METFQTIWKFSRHSGNFPDNLVTCQHSLGAAGQEVWGQEACHHHHQSPVSQLAKGPFFNQVEALAQDLRHAKTCLEAVKAEHGDPNWQAH